MTILPHHGGFAPLFRRRLCPVFNTKPLFSLMFHPLIDGWIQEKDDFPVWYLQPVPVLQAIENLRDALRFQRLAESR